MLHEEANRQLLESLDAASRRAQAAFMPAKSDIVAIVLSLRGLVVNLADDVAKLRADLDRRLQQLCDHEWQWHQIAGEGQFCRKCGADNPDCDD